MSDLDAHLDTLGPDLDDTTRDTWSIDGPNEAGWAMRKLARALREEQRIVDQANDRIGLIEQWRDQAVKAPRRDAEFFAGKLAEWRRLLEETGEIDAQRDRTYRLPEGTIARRKSRDTVEWTDPDLFQQWVDTVEEPDLVAVTVKPRADELHKRIASGRFATVADPDRDNELVVVDTATGEQVPGVRVRVGIDRIDVRPDQSLTGGES